jgi:hypothetical protein
VSKTALTVIKLDTRLIIKLGFRGGPAESYDRFFWGLRRGLPTVPVCSVTLPVCTVNSPVCTVCLPVCTVNLPVCTVKVSVIMGVVNVDKR